MVNILKQLCACPDCATIRTPCECGAPHWDSQPNPASVVEGNPAIFIAAAVSGPDDDIDPDSYQWQASFSGGPFLGIAGATDAVFVLPAVTLAMDGTIFRNTATFGAVTIISDGAELAVTEAEEPPDPPDPPTCPDGYTQFNVTVCCYVEGGPPRSCQHARYVVYSVQNGICVGTVVDVIDPPGCTQCDVPDQRPCE